MSTRTLRFLVWTSQCFGTDCLPTWLHVIIIIAASVHSSRNNVIFGYTAEVRRSMARKEKPRNSHGRRMSNRETCRGQSNRNLISYVYTYTYVVHNISGLAAGSDFDNDRDRTAGVSNTVARGRSRSRLAKLTSVIQLETKTVAKSDNTITVVYAQYAIRTSSLKCICVHN